MKVLVTGADGFVGGWLLRELLGRGHTVSGVCRTGGQPSPVLRPDDRGRIEWRSMELGDTASVVSAMAGRWDAVVHLAAVSSGAEARQDPGHAWEVNAAGTARVVEALGSGTCFLLVSTGEVYGMGTGGAHGELDPVEPVSPYAASKAAAELAALEAARRRHLKVIVARAFPHTGPGQDSRFVIPALAARVTAAKRAGRNTIPAGNLDPVRDLLDVRDVAAAYVALLERGAEGGIYNIASGTGLRLREVLDRLQRLAGWQVSTELDSSLGRTSDIMHLVGDASMLRSATGWAPQYSLDRTLQDLLDAQTD
ncbi:MAG TPA: NAD-dependent epimerase/dehydratase family protein [Gemmatimonadales bacterium]|nr:NAD-dependent epimerase/dehydratase family protein [Gemmatimonadales bacterium]